MKFQNPSFKFFSERMNKRTDKPKAICYTLFHSWGHKKLVQNGTVVSEKIWFIFLYVHDLGPRSRNDLDLQYSHTFMKSISCLYLSTVRSQASIVSEKSTVFTFSYGKA